MMFGRAPDAGEVAAALHDTMIAASISGGPTGGTTGTRKIVKYSKMLNSEVIFNNYETEVS